MTENRGVWKVRLRNELLRLVLYALTAAAGMVVTGFYAVMTVQPWLVIPAVVLGWLAVIITARAERIEDDVRKLL